MAAIEKCINNVSILFKRLFRKYKLLHTCRMLPLMQFNIEPLQTYDHVLSRHEGDRLHLVAVNSESVVSTRRRNFFSFPSTNRRKEFRGRKLVGFSKEQMFDVVTDVNKYKTFLPFCKKSEITMHKGDVSNGKQRADLVIGFPPIVERYTSHIRYTRPNFILAESHDATLFDHLITNWKFGPGLKNNPRSCVISFYVSFEFKTLFHSQLANMFFNELVHQMENAFYDEAIRRYGSPSLQPIKLKILPHTPTSSIS